MYMPECTRNISNITAGKLRLVPPEAEVLEEGTEDPDGTTVSGGKADVVDGM